MTPILLIIILWVIVLVILYLPRNVKKDNDVNH